MLLYIRSRRPTGGRNWSDLHLKLGRHKSLKIVAGKMSKFSLSTITLEVQERNSAQLVLTRVRLA